MLQENGAAVKSARKETGSWIFSKSNTGDYDFQIQIDDPLNGHEPEQAGWETISCDHLPVRVFENKSLDCELQYLVEVCPAGSRIQFIFCANLPALLKLAEIVAPLNSLAMLDNISDLLEMQEDRQRRRAA